MSDATVDPFELLPIPDRSSGSDHEPMEGMGLTDESEAPSSLAIGPPK